MKTRIALSVNEMHALEGKGLDTSDASMCWVRDPNGSEYRLTVHDEFCYEMQCLKAVPTYTLEDIILKLNGDIGTIHPETIIEYPFMEKTPWLFSVDTSRNEDLEYDIRQTGPSPLGAAFAALCRVLEENPKCIKNISTLN